MKHILTLLFSLLAITGYAANPAFTAFIGTNQVVISSNVTTGKILIGPATPISTIASNAAFAASVWTNRGTSISISPAISPIGKPLIIGDGIANPAGGNIGAIYSYNDSTNKDDLNLFRYFVSGGNSLTGADEHDLLAGGGAFTGFSAVNGYWFMQLTNAGGLFGGLDFNDRSGVYNMACELSFPGSATDFGGESMGIIIANSGAGKRNTSLGIHATRPNLSGTQTNIGIAVAMKKSGSGPYTGLYVEAYDSSADTFGPNYRPAIAILDSRKTGLPILQAGTNNGAFIALEVTDLKTTNATVLSSANGFASFSTTATNQIPTTGWTNNAAINVTVYTTATAVSFTINNRAGTVLYTSPTLTATLPVNLQPGWSIRSASGLTGTVLPF